MASHSADLLIGAWDPSDRTPAHRRLAAFLAVAEGGNEGAGETLGERNRRILLLHRAFVGTPIEAQVACGDCGVDNEFLVPVDAILAASEAPADRSVRVRAGDKTLVFRLPRMDDVEAASTGADVDDVRRLVLERCLLEGDSDDMTEEVAGWLDEKFEALDPASNVVVHLRCSGCREAVAASVDLASFVARDFDRLVEGLYREIDALACAYGWNEATILALPPKRRGRYVGMIAARAQALPNFARRRR